MAQFNGLKRSTEEKQDQLSQDLQALVAQLRNLNSIPEAVSNHDGTDEEVAARLVRQLQRQDAAHARRPVVQGHGNGGNGAGRGIGRGCGDRRSEYDVSDDADKGDDLE
jgi:hypothetical protein